MSPESDGRRRSFVLFSHDAGFARAVIDALTRRDWLPSLVALPEYPPASGASTPLFQSTAGRHFPPWFDNSDILYLPRARQQSGASEIESRALDFILVACWPYLLAPEILGAVGAAALNLHPSLLPAYRGPDPIGAQLEAGESEFGVTLHELNQNFDQGDIVAQRQLPRAAADRLGLERECADLGVDLFIEAMRQYPAWQRRAQPL